MGIRLMAASTQYAGFSPRAETDIYLKRAQQMGKSLITTSTQWINSSLMAMSQWTLMPRVIAEQQTNTCP